MDCDNCGSGVSEGWKYCPFCGSLIGRSITQRFPAFSGLEDLLRDIDEEFKKMEDAFKCVWPDSKTFEPIKGGGITIRISSEEGEEPKVNVQTFGDYQDRAGEVEERLGVKKDRGPPKVTKEPKTFIERVGDRLFLHAKLPGVKSEEDIDVKRMAESIEIRAYADDMAYFTLFCIPPNSKIVSQKLENEEFIIEASA